MITATAVLDTFLHTASILAMHAPGAEPTYKRINYALAKLDANIASVPITGSGGLLGHLVLVLEQPAYAAISTNNVAYPLPSNQGAQPNIPQNATAAVISELRQQFSNALHYFQLYSKVDGCLKKCLLAATDKCFIIFLQRPNLRL